MGLYKRQEEEWIVCVAPVIPVGQSLRTGGEVWEYWILKGGKESGDGSGDESRDGDAGQSLLCGQVTSPITVMRSCL